MLGLNEQYVASTMVRDEERVENLLIHGSRWCELMLDVDVHVDGRGDSPTEQLSCRKLI